MRAKPDLALLPPGRPAPAVTSSTAAAGPSTRRFVCGYLGCDVTALQSVLAALCRAMLCMRKPRTATWVAASVPPCAWRKTEQPARRRRDRARQARRADVRRGHAALYRRPAARTRAAGFRACAIPRSATRCSSSTHARAEDWTLDRLAREVGLSRTAFAEPLHRLVGCRRCSTSPAGGCSWRPRRLESPGVSIAQAAAEVGYESEAAFNRAFKKVVGVPPGAWRRGHGGAGQPSGGRRSLSG